MADHKAYKWMKAEVERYRQIYTDTHTCMSIYTYRLELTFTDVVFFLPGNLVIEGSIGFSHLSEKLGCQLCSRR